MMTNEKQDIYLMSPYDYIMEVNLFTVYVEADLVMSAFTAV